MLRLSLTSLAAALAGAATLLSAQAPAGRGTLYIVGGGPQPPALVQEFVDLAGGRERARIVVFAMASASGERSGEAKAADLRALGAEARNVWITRDQAMTDSAAHLLDGATGIWFGGGDQSRLADILRGTPTERAIRARFAAGAVVGGTSAGAAVMSSVMITGQERAPGGARPDTTLDWVTIARDNTLTADGFGLVDAVVIDQHFLRRKRHNRLISLVLERPPHLGAGIDESTALVVHPDGTWSVRGASVVVIYDARQATQTRADQPLGAADLRMHVLPAGAAFDPRTGRATLHAGATRP
ncbi:MAG: cyanophycinase [Gemmatimonadetes bacterium]|nr:cyanophycinase [Gemmatimonadota bacterium]